MAVQQTSRTRAFAGPMMMAALLLLGCNVRGQESGPAPTNVTVAAPEIGDVTVWEEVAGRFQAVESVEVRPQITGRLLRAHFTDGQIVQRGAVLFTIDPGETRAAAAQARATRDLADAEFARAQRLIELDAISQQEFVARRQDALRQRAAAQAVELELSYTQVRAPISGRVSDRRVDAGNIVIADQTLLTTIVTQDPIHFEFSADPALARALPRPNGGRSDGAAVFAQIDGENEFAHRGRLDFLDNQVDPRSGVVRGRGVFANANGALTPGQFGRIRINRGELQNAMTVPEAAINSDQTRKFVLIVNAQNMVEPRPVELGPLVDGRRVVSGLEPDARVIVNGGSRVFPGMPVTARTEAEAQQQQQQPAQGG
jgi:RND family efflux transporter MFP subunit